MKNKKTLFLLAILISILLTTIYLNINIFKKRNIIENSNRELKKVIERKNKKEVLSYSKIIENFKDNNLLVKSFEKNKEGEMIFDIIYKEDSKKFKTMLENMGDSGYKYEIIKINMNFKENKGESFIKFKIYPM